MIFPAAVGAVDLADPGVDSFLMWDEDDDPEEEFQAIGTGLQTDGSTVSVSDTLQEYHAVDPTTYIKTLLDDADAATARATLGIGGGAVTPQQVVIVAKANGDYTSIQSAIDSIGDNATGKRYIVMVYPGTYTENITIEDFVSVVGVGGSRDEVIIDGTVTFEATSGSYATLANLSVVETTSSSNTRLITSNDGNNTILNCRLELSSSTADLDNIGLIYSSTAGEIVVRDSYLKYDFSGSSGGVGLDNHWMFFVDSATTVVKIFNSEFYLLTGESGDSFVCLDINASGATIDVDFVGNKVYMEATHANFIWDAYAFRLSLGTGGKANFRDNEVFVEGSTSGSSDGLIYFNSSGDIYSIGNLYSVNGFTDNYIIYNGSGSISNYYSTGDVNKISGSFVSGPEDILDPLSAGNYYHGILPTGTDPDIDVTGQVSHDTDGANETSDEVLRGYDGTNQFAWNRKLKTIQATIVGPNDLADALRDQLTIWHNTSGMTFTITEIMAASDTDDTALNVEVATATNLSSPTTVDALNIATNGTGVYYTVETTITDPTIAHDEVILLDFDDTDTPGYVKITIVGWFDADVD